MARDFTKNLANYALLGLGTVGSPVNGASAISICARIFPDTLTTATANSNVIVIGLNSNSVSAVRLAAGNGTPGGTARVLGGGRSTIADGFQFGQSTTVVLATAWTQMGAVLDIAGDSIRTYHNGSLDTTTGVTFGAGTYTHSASVNTEDNLGFARSAVGPPQSPTSTDFQVDGALVDVAVWNVDIGAEGMRQFGLGFRPIRIRPQNLVFWWPLVNDFATSLVELMRGAHAAVTGTIGMRSNTTALK